MTLVHPFNMMRMRMREEEDDDDDKQLEIAQNLHSYFRFKVLLKVDA